jgi:hypothetical protein
MEDEDRETKDKGRYDAFIVRILCTCVPAFLSVTSSYFVVLISVARLNAKTTGKAKCTSSIPMIISNSSCT